MVTRRAIKPEKQSSKTRLFSAELKSKGNIKNPMMNNVRSPESVMIEEVLGELLSACFGEGIILEVFRINGVLRDDLGEHEIAKPELKDDAEAK
jgi:hypothetical protein